MTYPKPAYVIGEDISALRCGRAFDKTVNVRPDLPCNIIVIHGVNDVGTSFNAVETGLCQGLDARLHGIEPGKPGMYTPGTYRMPTAKDKDTVEPDPDAVFFKRQPSDKTFSPIIPFYWGFRETLKEADTCNGQRVDRYGNRLDKDLSKNGGPFGNATNSLPDMWNKGLCAPADVSGDPVRPLFSAPGRMYMVLAAKRLAALIAMIRYYDKDEVVNIVAHSQGCLISLLAQAFLLDEGNRPADTLILTHPPYSLVEDTTLFFGAVESTREIGGGKDAAMEIGEQYSALDDRQTFDARLRTLANIVQRVVGKKHTSPPFNALDDQDTCHGMLGAKWKAAADRDNRGKVYLYFCPEDMTVALDNMQGIGWQGIPDAMSGTALVEPNTWSNRSAPATLYTHCEKQNQNRNPLSEIGAGFFQRVFTNKQRHDLGNNKVGPVLVGQAPHDFALRIKKEDDHAHVAAANRGHRARADEVQWPPQKPSKWGISTSGPEKREGLRTINGEVLHTPVPAELRGSDQIDPKNLPKNSEQAKLAPDKQGPYEELDPIDAAIAIASGAGLKKWEEVRPDPTGKPRYPGSPQPLPPADVKRMAEQYDREKYQPETPLNDRRKLIKAMRYTDGKVVATIQEGPNEARKRWQHEFSPKSFHGAIIGNAANHRNVTAYDVAIGGGKASSDPEFYKYLCAVADWRMQNNKDAKDRPSIGKWSDFLKRFKPYWDVEAPSRRQIITGNSNYYSTGVLPPSVPALRAGLPSSVVCDTLNGKRTVSATPATAAKSAVPNTGIPTPARKGGA